MRPITIATRQSPLALWQANHVKTKLHPLLPDRTIELLPLTTSGDTVKPGTPFLENGKGLFVKELEEALLDERADLAVHSMKDVPATFPKGLGIAAICERGNPFDAFVSIHYQTLDDLPPNAKIGTASLRRQSQLLAWRETFTITPLRGNVQTRLNKLNTGDYDAIILAAAGLERLGLNTHIRNTITPPIMLPACGQGAIGVECRIEDTALIKTLAALNCPTTQRCVETERLVNAKLGGNCHVPIAIYCAPTASDLLTLSARVLNSEGKTCLEATVTGHAQDATDLALRCITDLLKQGAAALLESYT